MVPFRSFFVFRFVFQARSKRKGKSSQLAQKPISSDIEALDVIVHLFTLGLQAGIGGGGEDKTGVWGGGRGGWKAVTSYLGPDAWMGG